MKMKNSIDNGKPATATANIWRTVQGRNNQQTTQCPFGPLKTPNAAVTKATA
jgi:hypothetical protein